MLGIFPELETNKSNMNAGTHPPFAMNPPYLLLLKRLRSAKSQEA